MLSPGGGVLLAIIWTILYGLALHSAGFFMQRGIKLLGWFFVLSGVGLIFAAILVPGLETGVVAHGIMGALFGILQLTYSVYLYSTEKVKQTA